MLFSAILFLAPIIEPELSTALRLRAAAIIESGKPYRRLT
jgi:hypothetical protein